MFGAAAKSKGTTIKTCRVQWERELAFLDGQETGRYAEASITSSVPSLDETSESVIPRSMLPTGCLDVISCAGGDHVLVAALCASRVLLTECRNTMSA